MKNLTKIVKNAIIDLLSKGGGNLFMNRDDKASISLKKLISVSVILLFVMGIAVMAASTKITNAKIILADGYEVNVLTSNIR